MDVISYAMGKKKGGVQPTGEIEITQNGITNVSGYATANVQVPQPSGKITITENGTDIDVSSYATADVSVGSSPILTIEDYNLAIENISDDFTNCVNNDYNNAKTAYTNNSVNLYSPDAECKRYMVYKDNNNKYKVAWIKNHIFFTDNNSTFSSGSMTLYSYGSFQTNNNGELYPDGYVSWNYYNEGRWQDNLYISNQSFDNVADLISAMQNNTLTYYSSNSSYFSEALYCNYIFGYYNNHVNYTISTGVISHNETIITMS